MTGLRRVVTEGAQQKVVTEAAARARQKKIDKLIAKVKEWRRKEDAATTLRRKYEKKLRRAELAP